MKKKNNCRIDFSLYICLFYLCGIIGWIAEVIFRSLKAGYLIIPGFLFGCCLPIYGFGALTMVVFFEKMTNKHVFWGRINITPIFIMSAGMVILTLMEYLTHFLLERFFGLQLWSYEAHKFNINGRVSLKQSIIFASVGTIFLYIIYPYIKKLILKLKPQVLSITAKIATIIFITDVIVSSINYFK